MSFFNRNPKGTVQGLNNVNNDVGQRAQNLSVLIYHIKSYYQVSHREKEQLNKYKNNKKCKEK